MSSRTTILLILSVILLLNQINTQPSSTPVGCDGSNPSQNKNNYYDASIIDEDSSWRFIAPSSTFYSAVSEPGLASILIFQKDKTIKMTAATLQSSEYSQTYTETNYIQILGFKECVIFCKQFDNAGAFLSFIMYRLVPDPTATDLERVKITWNPAPGDLGEGMEFDKIINYDPTDSNHPVRFIMKKSDKTAIFYKAFNGDGPVSVSDSYKIADSPLDITSGNQYLLFDKGSKKFYAFNAGIYQQKDPQTDYSTYPILDIFDSYSLFKNYFAFDSISNDRQSANFAIFNGAQLKKQFQTTGIFVQTSRLMTDNIFNILIYSDTLLGQWINIDKDENMFECSFSTCIPDVTVRDNTHLDFFHSMDIIFDLNIAFLAHSDNIKIYKFITTLGSEEIVKISEVLMSKSLTDALTLNKSVTIHSSIKCLCSQTRLVRFSCFAGNFNCVATRINDNGDCSLPIDNNK